MNEITLSNDINRIETEIQFYKEKAGESIWEIGRRLDHVKKNDLAHGEFRKWHESIGIDKDFAYKSMRISKELPNVETLRHLGSTALDLIATLPQEERDIEHVTAGGETKTVDEMTVRELQELKRKLKEKDQTIEEQQNIINQQADAEPEVIEKIIEVEKEVQHPHVEDLRSDNAQLSEALREARKEIDSLSNRHDFVEKEYNRLIEERAEVNEKSNKYDQLTEAINNAKGELTSTQRLISDHKQLMKVLKQGNELLMKVSGLAYLDISNEVTQNTLVKREFDSLINGLERLAKDLRNMKDQNIIEGEFVNE